MWAVAPRGPFGRIPGPVRKRRGAWVAFDDVNKNAILRGARRLVADGVLPEFAGRWARSDEALPRRGAAQVRAMLSKP